jgi:two-component system nitrate/nitrite response regulator NarL
MQLKRQRRVRILLVDDHPIVLSGLRNYISSHAQFKIVGAASDGARAIQKAKETHPDIVLMDITLPGLNGIEATKALRKEVPKAKVIALTMHDDKEHVLEIIRAGAMGYVLKDTLPSELIQAINAVHSGGSFFSPTISRVLADQLKMKLQSTKLVPISDLTRREEEVLGLIADGKSNKEIAKHLSIGIRTVETHREHIMRKLNIHSAVGLAKYAIAKGTVKAEL